MEGKVDVHGHESRDERGVFLVTACPREETRLHFHFFTVHRFLRDFIWILGTLVDLVIWNSRVLICNTSFTFSIFNVPGPVILRTHTVRDPIAQDEA